MAVPYDGGLLQEQFAQEQSSQIKLQLWRLLAKRTERYNMGDSSSVRVEVAGELMESILCTLSAYQASIGSNLAGLDPNDDFDRIFDKGLAIMVHQLEQVKGILSELPSELAPIPNQAYRGICTELDQYIAHYDVYYFAHKMPGYLGYPLCRPVENLQGISYVNEYLRRFRLENSFCRHFAPEVILPLLRAHNPYYEFDLFNIFHLVFACAAALCMVQKSPVALHFSEVDRQALAENLQSWRMEDCVDRLSAAVEQLGRLLRLPGNVLEYCRGSVQALAAQMRANATHLETLLPSPRYTDVPTNRQIESPFTDGERMKDDALQDLIEKLSDLPLAERVKLVQSKVHSISDLMEVLGVSFWGEECIEYFTALGPLELAVLLHVYGKKLNRKADWTSTTGWEQELKKYVFSLPEEEKNYILSSLSQLSDG